MSVLHDQEGKLFQRAANFLSLARRGDRILADDVGAKKLPLGEPPEQRLHAAVGADAHFPRAAKIRGAVRALEDFLHRGERSLLIKNFESGIGRKPREKTRKRSE